MNYKKKLWLGCSVLALAGHAVTLPAVVTAETWQARQLHEVMADVVVTEENAVSYSVQYGDTLGVISEAMNIDLRYLASINNIDNVDLIFPETLLTAQFDDNNQADSLTVSAPNAENIEVAIPVNLSPIETVEEAVAIEETPVEDVALEEAPALAELVEVPVESGNNDPIGDAPEEVGAPTPEEEAPVEEAPIEEAPVEEAPVEEAPIEEAPIEEAPVEEAPVEEAPVEEAPVEEAPVEEAPIEETPVEEAPIEEAPVEEAPIEEAPAEEAPIEEAPIEEAPIEEAPIEEAPIEEAPVEEAPVEEAPIEEAPVEEAPVEEAPIEEVPEEIIPEEPVYEEPVIEEPVYEEPVVEEPVYEEPVAPDLNGLSYSAAVFRDEIVNMFGVTAYGLRPGDAGDHGSGLAVDFMVPVGSDIGDAIANYAINNMGAYNISYVIWEQQIYGGWTGGWEWMEDRGSLTANHYDHVHVSFY